MSSREIAKPILKWVGGKTQIIDKLLAFFPREMKSYHDIFVGGGSTLIAMLSRVENNEITVFGKIHAYDLNRDLINFYKDVQKNPSKLFKKIHKLEQEYTACDGDKVNRKPVTKDDAMSSRESYYYWIRSLYNDTSNTSSTKRLTKSAMFLFLNKTCFRGIYRVGPHGFNVPFGHYKSTKLVDKKSLLEVSKLIQRVKFRCLDFEKSLLTVEEGDFIYLDPPYAPEKLTSFVKYTFDGFPVEKHEKLFSMCCKLHCNGVQFVMSNSKVALVENTFREEDGFLIETVKCRRAINSKNPAETTNEIIIATI